MAEVMVVIAKVHDLILWIVPLTERFPRGLRFTLADRIFNGLLDLPRLLLLARHTRERKPLLDRANLEVEYTRHILRLAEHLRSVSIGKYEHAVRGGQAGRRPQEVCQGVGGSLETWIPGS